jgi:starch-binding outer membrane protein, SusD/RagB family
MKKYSIIISLVLLATFIFFSCNDDFLYRTPLDEISNETFWNTENDLIAYNNSLYDRARDDRDVNVLPGHMDGYWSSRASVWYLDEFSDNIAPRHSRHELYQKVRAGKHQPQNGARWWGWHSDGWRFIREVNVGMDNYDKVIENGVAVATVNKYKAEASLFRAMWYARKVFLFGDIPWVDTELNIDSEELYGSRTPKNEVMDNVLADLEFACTWLPDDWGDGNAPGRLNRWTALLQKSRICLYQGTWLKYHGEGGETPWLEKAAEAAKELIENGPYSLYTTGDPENDYQVIHKMIDLSGNPEVIYWERFDKAINTNHVQSYHQGYNGGATKSLVEDYLCTDGLPISLSAQYQGDATLGDVFANRDPRLRQTILHPDDISRWQYNKNDTERTYPRINGMEGGLKSYTGYHIIKVYEVNAAHASYNSSDSPAIVMRFAEALLNYAEAMAELGTITQTDLDMSINKLRDRVNMPHLTMDPPMDPRYADEGVSALIQEIRRERRIELFMEGFRYDDIRRWKQGQKLTQPDLGIRWDTDMQSTYDPDGKATVQTKEVDGVPYLAPYVGTDWENPEFDENKHYFWPIPIDAIAQNPNLEQTTGW